MLYHRDEASKEGSLTLSQCPCCITSDRMGGFVQGCSASLWTIKLLSLNGGISLYSEKCPVLWDVSD